MRRVKRAGWNLAIKGDKEDRKALTDAAEDELLPCRGMTTATISQGETLQRKARSLR